MLVNMLILFRLQFIRTELVVGIPIRTYHELLGIMICVIKEKLDMQA